jgi:RepB DNA-primase from phage plasmid
MAETSPGNFQASLNHGQVLPKQLSTLAARFLAERFGGDKGAADWRHFGRLAGLDLALKPRTPDAASRVQDLGLLLDAWEFRWRIRRPMANSV